MAIGEFNRVIQQRIDDLRRQLQEAQTDDDCAETARVEFALRDLERLHREHRTE